MQQNVERICLQAMQGLSSVVQLWCRLYFSEMREEARLHDEKHTKALASRHMKLKCRTKVAHNHPKAAFSSM